MNVLELKKDIGSKVLIPIDRGQLDAALCKVNMHYAGNVIYKRLDVLNASGSRWRVTLRVVSSKGKGHKVSKSMLPFGGKERNIVAACWHVHGYFFDAVLDSVPGAVIRVCRGKVYNRGAERVGNWLDFNVGSQAYPIQASESCNCEVEALAR
jgi:hypothetical protein